MTNKPLLFVTQPQVRRYVVTKGTKAYPRFDQPASPGSARRTAMASAASRPEPFCKEAVRLPAALCPSGSPFYSSAPASPSLDPSRLGPASPGRPSPCRGLLDRFPAVHPVQPARSLLEMRDRPVHSLRAQSSAAMCVPVDWTHVPSGRSATHEPAPHIGGPARSWSR